MNQLLEYVYILKPKQDNFMERMSKEDLEILEMHQDYCHKLTCAGTILNHSINLNGSYEMIIFKAESSQDAEQIFAADPIVKAAVMKAELHVGVSNDFAGCREETTLILSR